ncbi:probable phosphoglycerate mutase [Pseudonocardia thermophila]|uniref:Probable phosphoglycerate mutase n=1 Tax=Pseudonocardia thermophila TaxID=1848 RepID=A0A1M6WRZ2_PSETH|nr:histidine phosphatase family protein [Pseudonocardia thermophila]SHK96295.1 probable phosphoglycerate mutase [Pseudonocardia thermophila]
MTGTFYLVRHGETSSNLIGALDTAAPGPGLTERGREQARSLVAHFRDIPIASIHVSNLTRTHQTAAPLAADRGLEPIEHAGLREVGVGELEGRSDHASVATYHALYRRWLSGEIDDRLPGGESAREALERTDAVLCSLDLSHGPAVVFSHGSTIRLWVAMRCVNVEPSVGARFIENTAVVKIAGGRGTWRLESWDQRTDPARDAPPAGSPAPAPSDRVAAADASPSGHDVVA